MAKTKTKKVVKAVEQDNSFGVFGRGQKSIAEALVKITKKNPDGFKVELETLRTVTGKEDLKFSPGLRRKVISSLLGEGFTLAAGPAVDGADFAKLWVIPVPEDLPKADKLFKKVAIESLKKEKEEFEKEAAKRLAKARAKKSEENEVEDAEIDVSEMGQKELLSIIKEKELDVKLRKKMKLSELRELVAEALEELNEDEEIEIEDDDDKIELDDDDDDEVEDEDENEPPSTEEIKKMSSKQLKAVIDDFDLDVEPKGMKLNALRAAVVAALDDDDFEDE